MAMRKPSHKRQIVRRLMIAPGMLVLVTGLTSMAHAQSGSSGSRFEEARIDENQARLVAPVEGTWIQKILPAGAPAPFIALVSFAAGGVTEATGTADRNSPFASAAAPQSILIGSWRQS